ncbi:MAG TPA: peptidoglycan-binding protein [Ilumatobacteraceae bacterium]
MSARLHRRTVLGVLAGSVVTAIGGTTALRAVTRTDDAAVQTDAPPAPTTATVTRRDLVIEEELSGRLGYGDAVELPAQHSGTVTWMPPVGTIVSPGEVLWRIDDLPVVLIRGELPAYRALSAGVQGTDVGQLETYLVEAGHLELAEVGDHEFAGATVRAVRRWQEALGVKQTGRVELGDVVMWSGPVRVAEHVVALGNTSGGAVMKATGTTQDVRLDVSTERLALIAAGDAVTVVLPDDMTTPGRVTEIGRVAQSGEGGGDPTVLVVVELESASEVFDEAPVTLLVEKDAARDVLTVPVAALVALAEGGYALERVGDGGATALVGVELGAIVDGIVEVRGDITEGDVVVTAA